MRRDRRLDAGSYPALAVIFARRIEPNPDRDPNLTLIPPIPNDSDMNQRSTAGYRAPLALLLLGMAVLIRPSELSAQAEDTLATLTGQVLSRSRAEPIEQAFVFLLGNGKGGMTDEEGKFSIKDVAPGVDTVQVRYFGFEPSTTEVELQPGHVTNATLLISNTVLEVADLTVQVRRTYTGKLRGFEERRFKGFGDFITPQQIERRQPRVPSDMLRGIAGVVVGSERMEI